MTALEISSSIRTLGEVLNAMAPFAGGSVPDANDQEYLDWVSWIQVKQEEYAKRAFWRRCLTREEITVDGETTVLPDRFNRPNALFILIVDGVDWHENGNTFGQQIVVEMNNDVTDQDFGKWQMRFLIPPVNKDAIIWYYSNPPKPVAESDILLLPGDMIAYAALGQYFFTTGAEGSQDNADGKAEDRFNEYLSIEVIPDKSVFLSHTRQTPRVDYLQRAKNYYRSRPNRSGQAI